MLPWMHACLHGYLLNSVLLFLKEIITDFYVHDIILLLIITSLLVSQACTTVHEVRSHNLNNSDFIHMNFNNNILHINTKGYFAEP